MQGGVEGREGVRRGCFYLSLMNLWMILNKKYTTPKEPDTGCRFDGTCNNLRFCFDVLATTCS